MGSEHYCLRWNNHQANLLGVCAQLLRDERLVDVTLACADGRRILAHKVVLSACSAYFRELFVDLPAQHPIVILKDVRFNDLRTIIEFMYKGEVRVEFAQLTRLLQTAESLKVKGLAEMTREYRSSGNVEHDDDDGGDGDDDDDDTETADVCTTSPPTSVVPSTAVPEQTEPEELVNRRPTSICNTPTTSPPLPQPPPPPPPPLLVPLVAPLRQNDVLSPPLNSLHHIISDQPGPSSSTSLAPIQQVPLSLKKEVDWGGGDDKTSDSSDYLSLSRGVIPSTHAHDSSSSTSPPSDTNQNKHQQSTTSRASTPASTSAGIGHAPLATPHHHNPHHLLNFPLLIEAGLLTSGDGIGSAPLFRCVACLAAFPSPWLLEQHCALQHLNNGVGASTNSSTLSQQQQQQQQSSSSIDKPFICDQCGQSYRYRSAYVKHREQNHRARLPADKLFSCDVCGMQFRYLKSFKKHRLNHTLERLHGGRMRTSSIVDEVTEDDGATAAAAAAVAPFIGSDQVVSSSNETVVKTETDDDDNGLDGAHQSAAVEQDDTIDSRGLLTTSSTTSVMAADGTVAMATLSVSASSAVAHAALEIVNNNNGVVTTRERRFACPFCGKCVRSKENLKLHVRKHTGERPFVCLFCGRAFGGKSDLTRHLRIHTGERPYHCDMCGKCFARADYLSKHLTTHINTPR